MGNSNNSSKHVNNSHNASFPSKNYLDNIYPRFEPNIQIKSNLNITNFISNKEPNISMKKIEDEKNCEDLLNNKNDYHLLNINSNASIIEMQQAYEFMFKKFSPGNNSSLKSEECRTKIRLAFERCKMNNIKKGALESPQEYNKKQNSIIKSGLERLQNSQESNRYKKQETHGVERKKSHIEYKATQDQNKIWQDPERKLGSNYYVKTNSLKRIENTRKECPTEKLDQYILSYRIIPET